MDRKFCAHTVKERERAWIFVFNCFLEEIDLLLYTFIYAIGPFDVQFAAIKIQIFPIFFLRWQTSINFPQAIINSLHASIRLHNDGPIR